MTESWIDIVRRRIREGEERLRKAPSGKLRAEAPISKQLGLPAAEPLVPPADRASLTRSKTGIVEATLQQKFQALLPLLKESFILMDEEGGWELANPHLRAWLGYTHEEFKEVNLTDIFCPQDVTGLLATFPKWLSGEDPIVQMPCSLRDAQGKSVPVLLSSHAWIDETGKRVAYLVLEDARTAGRKKQIAAAQTNFEQVSASADHGDLKGKNFEAAREWSAYGQMTQGRMKQLSHFIAASVCDIADHIRSRQSIWAAEPALTKLLQTIDRTRRTLAQWYESAQSLPRPAQRLRVGDLLGAALAARKPELNRWGVEAVVHSSEMAAGDSLCPPGLFTAVLHILQACIEELRESEGKRRLDIRVQGTGERMEVAFVYDLPEPGTPETQTAGEVASMDYRSTNMELRAAQKLLESMGGTLVLENLAPHQRAIRMRLNIGVLASGNSELQIEKEEGAN
jgi:PAS domain S-box-containing protein